MNIIVQHYVHVPLDRLAVHVPEDENKLTDTETEE